MTSIPVHVWADVACPWCFIGKRRFEKAVTEFEKDGGSVEVEYHSFELSPGTPIDFEGSHSEFLANHLGVSESQAQAMMANVKRLAAAEGLSYDYNSLKTTRTLLAHQAIHEAKRQGKQGEFVERLYVAYFEQGRHLGKSDELVDLAHEVGLDATALKDALDNQIHINAVQADISMARSYGISGVPFYLIGDYGVSGAQDPAVFLQVLNEAAAAS